MDYETVRFARCATRAAQTESEVILLASDDGRWCILGVEVHEQEERQLA